MSTEIVTPFLGYYLCDHYVGRENMKLVKPEATDMLRVGTISVDAVRPFDKIYVQVDFFDWFFHFVFNRIKVPFVLITGQYEFPQLTRSPLTDTVLQSKLLVAWFSQNPIADYSGHQKYHAFPYGIINHKEYAEAYRAYNRAGANKPVNVGLLHINPVTNPHRHELRPTPGRLPCKEFYEQLQQCKYVISPAGDRDDCYRHYEAIGLGCIPISNVGRQYVELFGDNMCYAESVRDMDKLLDNKGAQSQLEMAWHEPCRDLVLVDYWIKRVQGIVGSSIASHFQ